MLEHSVHTSLTVLGSFVKMLLVRCLSVFVVVACHSVKAALVPPTSCGMPHYHVKMALLSASLILQLNRGF